MAQSDKPPFRVLLVEDNDDHALLITESLLLSEMEVTIERACDGAEALARITASRPPDAILLDLNMPGIGGHEVLETLKADPDLWAIPVVVLTTSLHHNGVNRAYRNNVNSFLQKSFEGDLMERTLDQFIRYWGGCNRGDRSRRCVGQANPITRKERP
jgi:CheY-like chemotaxis protein